MLVVFDNVGLSNYLGRKDKKMYQKFQQHLVKLGVSKHTVRAYLGDLRRADRLLLISPSLSFLNFERMERLNLKPATMHRMRASVRKYAEFLVTKGEIKEVPPKLLALALPKIQRKIPRMTTSKTAKSLVDSISDKELKLVILLLATTACSISSLADLKIEDFSEKTVTFTTSKGGKPYVSIFTPDTKEALAAHISGRTSGWVFTLEGGEKANPDSLRVKLRRRLGKNYKNPHSFRHGLATELLSRGADIFTVKEFMNHTSVSTTEGYIHLSPEYVTDKLAGAHPMIND